MSVYNFIIIDYWNIPTWKATSLRVTRAHSRIRAVGNTGYIKFFMGIHSRAGQLIGFYWTTINVITPWYIIYIYLSIYHSPSLHSLFLVIFSPSHIEWYINYDLSSCACVCLHVSFVHCMAYRRENGVVSSLYPFFLSAWDNFTLFPGILRLPAIVKYYFNNSSRTCACTHHIISY